MKREFCIGLLLLAYCSVATAAKTDSTWRRWAVICSPDVQKSRLGDLLTVELSRSPDLELVEREELAKIVSELELSQLSGENAAARLKLGRLLRADALVLVQRAGTNPKSPFQIIVAECRQGARLHQQELAAGPLDVVAGQIAKVVLDARGRFPHGIKQLLGVSDFVSRSLIHDYDSMQTRYADLLRATLSLQEGVAVLEIEEARSIARELMGEDLGNRLLPLIVEGEFRVDVPAAGGLSVVKLRNRLIGGNSTEEINSPALALDAAPRWIASELAQKALRRAAGQKPLVASEQVKLLTNRAEEFTALAAWEHAVKLREAALLVAPEADGQRAKLVDECLALVARVEHLDPSSEVGEVYPGSPSIKRVYGRKVDWYLQALEHVDYLVRNRRVDRNKALDLCRRVTPYALNQMPWLQVIRIGDSYYRIGQEELARAQKPARMFFLEVVPKVLELPPPVRPPERDHLNGSFSELWQSVFLDGVLQRTDVSYPVRKDLADLTRAYTQILPDRIPFWQVELPSMPSNPGPRAAMPEDYTAFYRALAESRHKVSSIRGRYMLLQQEALAGGLTPQRGSAILSEIGALKNEYRKLVPPGALSWSDADRLCASIRTAIQPPRRPGTLINRPAVDDDSRENVRSTGAVRFTPIDLKLRRLDGEIEDHSSEFSARLIMEARGMDIVKCGTGIDVYYCGSGLCVMRKPGLLEELVRDERSFFRRVVWDGRQLWAARHDGSAWVLGIDGKKLTKITAETGLPPSTDGPLLYPLAPGRTLAVGSFGDPPRTWAAELTWDNQRASVRVFFEAKRSPPPGTPRFAPREALDLGFDVRRIHPYQQKGESEPPLLLVERAAAHPLQINLKTLAVAGFPCEYNDGRYLNETIFFAHDGVLYVGHPEIELLAPPHQPWPDGSFLRQIPLANPAPPDSVYGRVRMQSDAGYMNSSNNYDAIFLEPGDGYLYFVGQFWHRIKLQTLTAERLNSTFMPLEYDELRNFGVSAHFGMVAWNRGQLLRITVDEASIPRGSGRTTK
jgi:hypothetical protein